MLSPVSSSSSLPSMGRAVLTESAAPAPTGRDPAGTVHAESVRPVLPSSRSDTGISLSRTRQPTQLPAHTQLPAPLQGDAPTTGGVLSDGAHFRIPTRLTLEIQKAREAIAETGGGLRAMQLFMQEIAQRSEPSLSVTV